MGVDAGLFWSAKKQRDMDLYIESTAQKHCHRKLIACSASESSDKYNEIRVNEIETFVEWEVQI